eukprot:3707055-Rhodomonas_salina.1
MRYGQRPWTKQTSKVPYASSLLRVLTESVDPSADRADAPITKASFTRRSTTRRVSWDTLSRTPRNTT